MKDEAVDVTTFGTPPDPELVGKAWDQRGWPLLQQYCLDCHNEFHQEAELDLSRFESLEGISSDGPTMKRVLNMVRFGAMPPEDAALPSDDERQRLGDLIDQSIYAVTCDTEPRPGKVTARRLNRAEYNHSVRDLFGMDLRPADDFPSDEVGGGFDNNADVLTLSPIQIEKYLAAAEKVSQQVLIDPASLPELDAERPGDQLVVEGEGKTGSFYGRFLSPEAFAWTEVETPLPGEYRLRLRGGNSLQDAEPSQVAIYDMNGLLAGVFELEHYGSGGGSSRDHIRVKLEQGEHRFFFEPIEADDERELVVGTTKFPKFDEMTSERIKERRKLIGKPLKPERDFEKKDYPFMLREFEIEGPRQYGDGVFPPSQKQIITSRPEGDGRDAIEKAAIECLQPLMRRAFRGPVTKDEVKPYAGLVADAVKRDESYERGLQIAVSAILVSPRFLFRVETPPEEWGGKAGEVVRLTQHQLASRLSYFVWSSTPDEALLEAADEGRLEGDELDRQIRRMLDDPKSESLATEFAAQWLGLRNLKNHQPDAERFNTFEPSLLSEMAEETRRFFLHALRNNRPVAELLTADYTFLNEPLAEYYGVEGVNGDGFRRVSLEGTPRRGLLGHASVLTLTSEPTRTSPVKRGKWILENVIGTPPPEPPSGVPELGETKTASEDATLREQLELHREDPSCAACHRVMDQLGFGLENFDAVGQFRESEGSVKIDASGVLPGGRDFAGAQELSRVLGETERKAFAKTVVQRLLGFALGRELTLQDRCTVDEIVRETEPGGYRFIDIVTQIVHSRPFLYYEWTAVASAE